MPPVVITEKRFREGTGERYLSDGSVRCQAVSKSRVRRWREAHQDWETPTDELFPECQCPVGAVPGMYACHWHGGETPSKNKPKSIFDVMPIDLGEKLKVLMDSPDYISRKEEINLLRARKWQILEILRDGYGGEEAWGMVADSLAQLRQGKLSEAEDQLEAALQTPISEKEVYSEIRSIDKLLSALTSTEVKSAKELKLMATADQVAALLNHIYNVINKAVDKYMSVDYMTGYSEKLARANFLNYVAGEIYKSANISPVTLNKISDGN